MTEGNGSRSSGAPMIVCDDVKKWFGDFQALRGVSTSVGEGEVVVVIGPSGSGKSTLIRCINRLEVHQEGRIIVDGIELTNDLRNIEKIAPRWAWFSSSSTFSLMSQCSRTSRWRRSGCSSARRRKHRRRPCSFSSVSEFRSRPTSTRPSSQADSSSVWR